MTRTKSGHPQYSEKVRDLLKERRKELGKTRLLYEALYGREPNKAQTQQLVNLLNRGNPSVEFLGLCVEKLNLEEMTLGELFGIKSQNKKKESK